jgi:hypothetical protein
MFFKNFKKLPESKKVIIVLTICIFSGLLIGILYATQSTDPCKFFAVAGVTFAIAGAALFTGGFLGFIFGIPKPMQQDGGSPGGVTDPQNAKDKTAIGYQHNTNLEQVSDWLTKILIGVGLTQLVSLPSFLKKFSEFVAPGLGNFENSQIFSISILVYFLTCGFILSYLWTRFNAAEFLHADLEAIGELKKKVDNLQAGVEATTDLKKNVENLQADMKATGDLKKEQDQNASAMVLVQQQLQQEVNKKEISQAVLDQTVREVTDLTRIRIYNLAAGFRHDCYLMKNWKSMANCIPVFKALINCDKENKYHKIHGQLGFALMDQSNPDYAEAAKELEIAISIRKEEEKVVREWIDYEKYMAICLIHADSGGKYTGVIKSLLEKARKYSEKPELFENKEEIALIENWEKSNP